ncbi:MAG: 5'/3'-nucleotidase SurE [Parvularculales bacterium]
MTSPPRILITNDDGIHAPGLEALKTIAKTLSRDVWVVAPETEQSGAAHSLTLSLPLRLRKLNPQMFAVQGTPTDCVVMAVHHIITDKMPDLVLSGVNSGQNIAEHVVYSGTIAGAMEGAMLGIPSIALSQAYGFEGHERIRWDTAIRHGPDIIRTLIKTGWPKDIILNINFPDTAPDKVTDLEVTRQGKRDQSLIRVEPREDGRRRSYFWIGFESIQSRPPSGTDLKAIYEGRISVTPLHMNMTHQSSRQHLAQALDGLIETPKEKKQKEKKSESKK